MFACRIDVHTDVPPLAVFLAVQPILLPLVIRLMPSNINATSAIFTPISMIKSAVVIALAALALVATAAAARTDQRADTILRQAKAAAQAARTIDGAVVYTASEPGLFTCNIISVRFQKPDKFVIHEWDNLKRVPDALENITKVPHTITIANGRWIWTIAPNGTVAKERQTLQRVAQSNIVMTLDLFRLKYQPGPGPFDGKATRAYLGKRLWNGALCDIIHVKNPDFKGALAVSNLYFDSNHILRGESRSEAGGLWKIHTTYTRFKLNTPLPHSTFRFHLPRYIRSWRVAARSAAPS